MVNMNREIGIIQLCNSFHKIRRQFFYILPPLFSCFHSPVIHSCGEGSLSIFLAWQPDKRHLFNSSDGRVFFFFNKKSIVCVRPPVLRSMGMHRYTRVPGESEIIAAAAVLDDGGVLN